MAKLIIFDDSVRGVDLPDRAVVVGRSLKADVPIRDRLLSRKHCTLVPDGDGYRFLDLRSANGSYVNGVRVERADLEYDDVIEIGSTVLVLLEADAWKRGDGLAKLRNPLKAQELIQRLRRRVTTQGDGQEERPAERADDVVPAAAIEALHGGSVPSDFLHWTKDHVHRLPAVPQLLEEFLTHKIASLLVCRVPELRACLSDAVERVLTPEGLQGDLEQLRALIRREIRTGLEEMGLTGAAADPREDLQPAEATQSRSEASDLCTSVPVRAAPSHLEPPEPTPQAESVDAGACDAVDEPAAAPRVAPSCD